MTRFAWLLVVAGSGVAAADPEPSAIATNLPVWWVRETSVAASLYVPVGARDAIRTNVATTTNHTSVQKDLSDLLDRDFSEPSRSGRLWDVGFGWTRYSSRLYSGFLWELGVLRRARNTLDEGNYIGPESVMTDTTTYAARAQIGWSWLLGDNAFVAAAVGMSAGYEFGSETLSLINASLPITQHVSRTDAELEGYLRFGFVP